MGEAGKSDGNNHREFDSLAVREKLRVTSCRINKRLAEDEYIRLINY